VTFRDDREALLQRAEALEREAERLRRENQELRDRRDAARALRAELRARAAKPAAATWAPLRVAPATAAPVDPDVGLQDAALAARWGELAWKLGLPMILVGCAACMVIGGLIEGPLGYVIAIPGCFGLAFGLLLVIKLIARWEARRERRWLAALPLPLDQPGYLGLLSVRAKERFVTVRFTPRDPVSPVDAALAAAVARGGRDVASAAWQGDHLVIQSVTFKTSSYHRGKTSYDNVPVHRWFRRLVDDVLGPIAKVIPPSTIAVA
jgi:hypothetical protein